MKKVMTGIQAALAVAIVTVMIGGCCQHCKKPCCEKMHKDKPCAKAVMEPNCPKK